MLKDFLIFFFWAGLSLQRNESSASPELHSEARILRPVLQPLESIPPAGIYSVKDAYTQHALLQMWPCVLCTGTYVLKLPEGKPCINVTMGVEYIVTEQKVRECVTFVPRTVVSVPVWMLCVLASACVWVRCHVPVRTLQTVRK